MSELFRPGGPHRIRQTGADTYEFSVSMPKDLDGRTARECPQHDCSPGYFKVKTGTGVQDQTEAFCPYCRAVEKPSEFITKDQIRYAREVVATQAHEGIQRMVKESLGLDSQGRRQLGGGLLKIGIEMKPSPIPPARRPWESILKRDLVCPRCTLDHSVYGFAVWCPDCGGDIFSTHVRGEINVINAMLADIERRKEQLGERVAAKDIENALEDLVSVFEATLKIELRRFFHAQGVTDSDIDRNMRRIGSRMQSVQSAVEIMAEYCNGFLLYADTKALDSLSRVFGKRHPITHNLGVVDRKYLERARSGDAEGEEVRVSEEEIEWAADICFKILEDFHTRLFPGSFEAAHVSAKSCEQENGPQT